MKRFKVYEHKSPSGKRYIGITGQEPNRRWQNGYGYIDNEYFTNSINKYGWENIEHNILHENLTKEEALELEVKYIKKHKSNNREYGYNMTEGGEVIVTHNGNFGSSNPMATAVLQIDPKTKKVIKRYEAISEACEELGIKHRGISKACIGVEARTYMGYEWEYANKLYVKPPRRKRGNGAYKLEKPVNQMDLNGNIIATYKSIKEAAEKTNSNRTHISNVCMGHRKTHNGSRWSYGVLE